LLHDLLAFSPLTKAGKGGLERIVEEQPGQLNPFGEALQRLMDSQGIPSVEELAEVLREAGSDYSAEEIEMWMTSDPTFLHIVDD
jgi:hypothetical protein